MKSKNGRGGKKLLASALAVILVLSLIISIFVPFFGGQAYAMTQTAEEVAVEEGTVSQNRAPKELLPGYIDVKAEIGFDNQYIVEKKTPFRFIVSNSGEDLKGELQIKVYTYYDDDSWRPSEYSVYYVPVEINKGGVKEVEINAYVPVVSSFFTVSITDEKGGSVYVKNFSVSAKTPEMRWTGVLSETPEELGYLEELNTIYNEETKYYDGVEHFKTVYLDKDTFPRDAAVLDNFRILIINNFNTRSLDEEQLEALEEWIFGGGTLIVGAGAGAKKATDGLGGIFTVKGETDVNAVSASVMEVAGGIDAKSGSINVNGLKLDGGNNIFETMPYAQKKEIGDGCAVLLNFDMGGADIREIEGILTVYDLIYKSAVPKLLSIEEDYNGYDYDTNYAPPYNYIDRFAPQGGSMLSVMFMIIAAYILLIGPVIYIVLKKKDKREKAWIIIPVTAVMVTVGVYALGSGSYYRKGIANFVSEIKLESGLPAAEATIYAGIKSGSGGNVNFTAEESVSVSTFTDPYYYGYSGGDTAEEICKVKVNAEANRADLTFFNSSMWDTNKFSIKKNIDMGGALTADVDFDGKTYKGVVTNTSNVDFYDVVLEMKGGYALIGDCLAGETVEINCAETEQAYTYDLYDTMKQIFGVDYYDPSVSKEEIFSKWLQTRLLMDYSESAAFSRYSMNDEEIALNLRLFAFNNDEIMGGGKYINGREVNEEWNNVFVMEAPVKYSLSEDWEIPAGFIEPLSILDEDGFECGRGSYGGFSEYIYVYPAGEVYADFYVPEFADAFSVSWPVSNMMEGSPMIFNVKMQDWEEIGDDFYENVSDYTDEVGIIKLKVKGVDDAELQIPSIGLKGGKTDAGN